MRGWESSERGDEKETLLSQGGRGREIREGMIKKSLKNSLHLVFIVFFQQLECYLFYSNFPFLYSSLPPQYGLYPISIFFSLSFSPLLLHSTNPLYLPQCTPPISSHTLHNCLSLPLSPEIYPSHFFLFLLTPCTTVSLLEFFSFPP